MSAPRSRPLELGLLGFVAARAGEDGAARGLADGLDLFVRAEELGFSTGWVRQRHFEAFLSSPMVFLTAAAMRTTRLHLGTGVIPMRYEEPVRLAADATTADLLSGGRLELGLASGIPVMADALDPVYGASERGFAAEAADRTARFRAAVAGEPLREVADGYLSVPPGGALTVTPPSPGLVDRLWYGAGTRASAARAGEAGYHLLLSTLNGEETGEPFDVAQREQVRVWREARAAAGHDGRGRSAAGRIVVPICSPADADEHRAFLEGYRSGMDAQGRPLAGAGPAGVRYSPVITGSPEEVTEALLADAALPEVDQLVLTMPAEGSLDAHRRVLEVVAREVAPHLGWVPAG